MTIEYVDFDEMARHGCAILPDGYLHHRNENPFIADLMIWGVRESEAAAIALCFADQRVDQDWCSFNDWTVTVYGLPTETAESFSSGLGEWLKERGV